MALMFVLELLLVKDKCFFIIIKYLEGKICFVELNCKYFDNNRCLECVMQAQHASHILP